MTSQQDSGSDRRPASDSARARLLAGLPVTERRLDLAGVSTAILEGGDGPPVVLLHGPGEFAASWLTLFPDLVRTNRIVAPDLPGHGASTAGKGGLDAASALQWLDELIERTCPTPPVLVGRIVGGAIAARFAIDHGSRLSGLVLVDTLGLTAFEPAPRFGLAMHRFLAAPTGASYDRFMEFCSFDLDGLREQLGDRWEPFASYAVELAGSPAVQGALGSLIGEFGGPIPPTELARIEIPTTLIWGRHDLATPLQIAESASASYGWPLHVIEHAGDDPALEQPGAFLEALGAALEPEAAQPVFS